MARLTQEQIHEIAKESGFKFISGEYKNLKTVLMFECKNGHAVPFTVEKLRKKPKCPVCEQFSQKDKAETDMGNITVKKGHRVLAMDNATKTSGWAILENGKPIESGVFEADRSKEPIERIIEVSHWLSGMIYAWEIDTLGLENVQYGGNAQTLILLSKLLGVLEVTGYEILQKSPIVVSVNTWRSYCGIKGANRIKKKESAQDYVREKFGIVASQDRAEAICLGVYVASQCKFDTEMISW
jgi:Holliday junction resolvasome RuvABC endonuclease subunit